MTDLTSAVRSKYASVAASSLSNDTDGVRAIASAFGYSADELAAIPAEANMGLSCGNPTATAHLKAGETVLDLGSGGGLDVFLAAKKVGPTGRAIGVDMTPEMVDRANRGAHESGFTNVAFYLSTIDCIPLPDASVDVIISNCVINLAPDKPAVFREMFRVLKPGGRIALSDITLKKPLPLEFQFSIAAYTGCIAGALLASDYVSQLTAAGFAQVAAIDTGKDLNAYAKLENQSGCCSPTAESHRAAPSAESCCGGSAKKSISLAVKETPCCTPAASVDDGRELHTQLADLLTRFDVNAYAASCYIYALKP